VNQELLEKIIDAVLYEGYILYPYRPSVKNHQRWTFGGLYPDSYDLVRQSAESCVMQTQCLLEGSAATSLQVNVRFLHLTTRTVGKLREPVDTLVGAFAPSPGAPGEGRGEGDFDRRASLVLENHPHPGPLPEYRERGTEAVAPSIGHNPTGDIPSYEAVESLSLGGKVYQSWQEASERRVTVQSLDVGRLAHSPVTHPFFFAKSEEIEPLRNEDAKISAVLIRRQVALAGVVEVTADEVAPDLFRIGVRVVNRSHLPRPDMARDAAQLYTLASTHTILGAENGAWVSSIDPPEHLTPFSKEIQNVGSWPVLVGREPERDTMLASPIILYDYPQIAPESPRNLFDSTEIDEILSLRIMTLSDEEKQVVAGSDDRAAQILQRTDELAREQLASLHGTLRGLRPVATGETP
jgi:hypothetical protein